MTKSQVKIDNIDKARAYFKEKKNEVYKLAGHPLTKESEYVKELYVAMLCSVAAYDGQLAEGETNYIKRVMLGMELNSEFAKVVKMGLEIDQKMIDEFVKAFSGNDYSHCFLADSLVVAASDGVLHDKEIELISEISELLLLTNDDLENVSKLVSILFEMKSDVMEKFIGSVEQKINFDYLIKSFILDFVNPESYELITGEMNYTTDTIFTKKIILFQNAKISIAKGITLKFDNQQDVQFVNCEIKGGENNPIIISNTNKVIVYKSKFASFRNRVFVFDTIANLSVEDCVFDNCGYYFDGGSEKKILYGGVFKVRNSAVLIKNCIFNECYIENMNYEWGEGNNYTPRGYIATFENSNGLVDANIFKGCFAKDHVNYRNEDFVFEDKKCNIILGTNFTYKKEG